MDKLLMLGRDFTELGRYTLRSLEGIEAALSVGADANSPAYSFKGDLRQPNEDALLVLSAGSRCLLAVADAHFGVEASHRILERLAHQCQSIPARQGELVLALMAAFEPPEESRSGSTLLLVSLDRATGKGFGLSFGDSSVVTLGGDGARLHNAGGVTYVHTHSPPRLEDAETFDFQLAADELLLLYTDGVNECQYRSAETSVTLSHLQELPAREPARLSWSWP